MTVFQTSGPIDANVKIQVGSIHLIASDRDDITVVVNPTDPAKQADVEAAEKTEVDLSDDRLVVKTPQPGGVMSAVLGKYGSVEVTIELPVRSSVDVSSGQGDVRIDGRVGGTKVKSGVGDVHVDETAGADLATGAGNLSLSFARGETRLTAAGDMRVGQIDGNAVMKNMNGKTWVDEVTGHLRMKSANGDIEVGRVRSTVVAKTDNGAIHINEVENGSVSLETGFGGLQIGVGEGVAAWVDARTKFGRVHNSLEATDRPGSSDRSVEITARTSFGDITVYRAGGQE